MPLNRRQALTGLGIISGVMLTGSRAVAQLAFGNVVRRLPDADKCILTRQVAEGPFYLASSPERSDIAEGRRGLPIGLSLRVIEAGSCSPVPGARVAIWHADAAGCYSGFQAQGDERDVSTVGQEFMRGSQSTDANGAVSFSTVYPGWYAGRAPHIRYKVFAGRKPIVTGQLYFPDDFSEIVFTTVAPYNKRKRRRDTTNAGDLVARLDGRSARDFFTIRRNFGRYVAKSIITVGG